MITEKKVDFCAHILQNPFDTVESDKESFRILRKLSSLGFSKVVCAPRYVKGKKKLEKNFSKKLMKQARELGVAAKYHGINMKIEVMSEVYVCPRMDELLFSEEVVWLDRKYLLVKLPESVKVDFSKIQPIISAMTKKELTPILLGAEKCEYLKDEKLLEKLSKSGVMFCCLYGSIGGMYGKTAMKNMTVMLQKGYCDFLGTDVMSVNDKIFAKFPKIEKKIGKIIGEDGYRKIMRNASGI